MSLETMIDAYIEAMYFTEVEDPDVEFTLETLNQAKIDCRIFYNALTRNIDTPFNWERVGQDFWLTRNGHGVGFWDRPEVYGDPECHWLTTLADVFGEVDVEFR